MYRYIHHILSAWVQKPILFSKRDNSFFHGLEIGVIRKTTGSTWDDPLVFMDPRLSWRHRIIHQKLNGTESQRTLFRKMLARAIRFSGFRSRGLFRNGPVGDFLDITLPETNIAPENEPLEKEIPIGNHHF